jgi:transposase
MGISAKTYRRWKLDTDKMGDLRPTCERVAPPHKLTAQERQLILETCNSSEYASLPPSQIVPLLADKGIYLASESSMYRVLNENDQQHHRGRTTKRKMKKTPSTHTAVFVRQVDP